jgi:hypothetical protein
MLFQFLLKLLLARAKGTQGRGDQRGQIFGQAGVSSAESSMVVPEGDPASFQGSQIQVQNYPPIRPYFSEKDHGGPLRVLLY